VGNTALVQIYSWWRRISGLPTCPVILWIRLLASGHKNICCVGDETRSIYGGVGWRSGNILRSKRIFLGRMSSVGAELSFKPAYSRPQRGVIAGNRGRLGEDVVDGIP